MYYAIVLAATAMFGVQFLINGKYQEKTGSSFTASMAMSLIMGAGGFLTLFAINGFRMEMTPFSLIMAVWSAVNSMLFTLCSLFALGRINLSVYSLFSMTGGMTFPFIAGIFFGEGITLAKSLCLAAVFVGICLTVERGEKGKGRIFYVGVFVFNGIGALTSVFYSKLDFAKVAPLDYSVTSSAVKAVVSLIALAVALIVLRKTIKPTLLKISAPLPLVFALACGVLNATSNYMLLISLVHIPSSLEYLLVTGGVMVASTVLGFFTGKKPKAKDIAAVGVCIAGMLCLFIPI